jgi:hypothetical protein
MNRPMARDPRMMMAAMLAARSGGFGPAGMRPSVAGCDGWGAGGWGGIQGAAYPNTYGYALPGYGNPQAAALYAVADAAAQCTKNPDGSWNCPPGMAPNQPMPLAPPAGGGCLPLCPPMAPALLAPTCPPVAYPINSPCNEDGLVLPPVNPCDPFSLFCALFGRRRGLQRTTVGIPQTTIAPGTTVTIPVPVGFYFIPCSLRIPSDIINAGLVVNSITSGNNEEIQGPVPARLFSEVAEERIQLAGNPAGAFGGGLTITVTNQTQSPIVFQGAFFGTEFQC